MTLLQILVLALVQGITEFLPISSSGHLVLVPALTGWPDQGLDMDVAVHVGTLLAVILYFHKDVLAMAGGLGRMARGRRDPMGRLALQVAVATVPIVVVGLLLKDHIATYGRLIAVIGWTTLIFGILLWVVDRLCMTVKRAEHMSWVDVLVVGFAQVLALVPGTSRSGITMTAARLMGYEREESARISMLLSIPTILGAGVLAGLDIAERGDWQLTLSALIGAGLAFVSALVAIALMMAWLRRASYTIFAVYRVILGIGLLAWAYGLL
ncbi:Undecaprenyl-diphosphatase [Caenispirillum salinarum AK4]|uniref:Undecaprenyl-diphosphatase n=1 Tax=Caenispirillum salinarum AK4 TaxID=1238182 RepID=K9H4G9_9PROT|nr:undecaprenyl-diphosphate phosphatase [Caenispirillum salinarum]EKV31984.1 Undecaprenyl-diphosphatase [Caenispirillum salinarum AK4]